MEGNTNTDIVANMMDTDTWNGGKELGRKITQAEYDVSGLNIAE